MYNFPTNEIAPGMEGFILIFYIVYFLIMMGFAVAVYVLQSLSIYTIAKRRGIQKPALAWVPVANVWLLGSISDQYRYVVKGEYKSKRKILLTLSILTAVAVAAVMFALKVKETKGINLDEIE